jgi:outer membrane lipoprotein SlyB
MQFRPNPETNIRSGAMNSSASRAVLVSIVVAAAAISGCASTPRDADTFGRGVSGEVQSVEWGTIQALRPVAIESGRRLTSDTSAVEFTVRLESGNSIVVVQPGTVGDYRVGDRVRVTNDGTQTRVAR